jgi:hypothetical protein
MRQQQLTEEQLDAIYKYLSISYEDMSDDEQKMWTLLLAIFDSEFDDVEN